MNKYDTVMLAKDLPDEGLRKWSVGTMLELCDDDCCQVEMSGKDGAPRFLGTLPKECLEVIWQRDSGQYVGRFEKLLYIFDEIKCLVDRPDTDFSWSSFRNATEFSETFDLLIENIKKGVPGSMEEMQLLFAPTSDLQDISIDSGWSGKYIEISSRFNEYSNL